jgi:multiple sugar transport system ATP-binding protein
MARVAISDVRKVFGSTRILHGVSVDIADTEFVVLVGKWGCGKSTLPRMIAGLENISGGTISIGGKVVNTLPPKDRDIAMVFQNHALDPRMTVFDNMGFSLKLANAPKEVTDAKPRGQMRSEIKEQHQRLKVTTVYVTHDRIEAMTMADKIVVMNHGLIEQAGAPLELHDRPANLFVAGFIGSPAMNMIKGALTGGHVQLHAQLERVHPRARLHPVLRAQDRAGGHPDRARHRRRRPVGRLDGGVAAGVAAGGDLPCLLRRPRRFVADRRGEGMTA